MQTELRQKLKGIEKYAKRTLLPCLAAGFLALAPPTLDKASRLSVAAVIYAQETPPTSDSDQQMARQLAWHIYSNFDQEMKASKRDVPYFFESCAYSIEESFKDTRDQSSVTLLNNAYTVQETLRKNKNQPIEDDLGVSSIETYGRMDCGTDMTYQTLIATFDPGMIRRPNYIWLDDPVIWNDPDAPDMVKIKFDDSGKIQIDSDDPDFKEKYQKYQAKYNDQSFIEYIAKYEKYLSLYHYKPYRVSESFGYESDVSVVSEIDYVYKRLKNPRNYQLMTYGKSPYTDKDCNYMDFFLIPDPRPKTTTEDGTVIAGTEIPAVMIVQRLENGPLGLKPVGN